MKNVRTIFRPSSIIHRPSTIVYFIAVVLFLCACPALGTIEFKDGLTHNIDYAIADSVWVDYQTPSMYTTVNLLAGGSIEMAESMFVGFEQSRINVSGGSIRWLESGNSSQVDISGGYMNVVSVCGPADISGGSISYFTSSVYSQVDISGGSISYVMPRDFSRVDISGGSIYWIYGVWSSQVDISGGTIGGGFRPDAQSTIKIFGSDFTVDGQAVGYEELTSIFGGSYNDEPMRQLTGTLASGELINSVFYIGHDARIILIPEPASAILMTLGTIIITLHRRKR